MSVTESLDRALLRALDAAGIGGAAVRELADRHLGEKDETGLRPATKSASSSGSSSSKRASSKRASSKRASSSGASQSDNGTGSGNSPGSAGSSAGS